MSCGFSVKIWSLLHLDKSETNLSYTCYHDKQIKGDAPVSSVAGEKRDFLVSRDETWTPRNKRPHKLREQLKILEAAFQSNVVVKLDWRSQQHLKIVFNNGLIADVDVSPTTHDLTRILFNKSLVGKVVTTPTLTSAGVCGNFLCVTFLDRSQIAFVPIGASAKSDANKLVVRDIPGPVRKELTRKICVSRMGEMVICWWKLSQVENVATADHVNTVLIDASNQRFDVAASLLTEEEIFDLQFSQVNPRMFLTLERPLGKKSRLHSVTYEVTSSFNITRLQLIPLALPSGAISAARSSDESKLAVGCSDGRVVVFDLSPNAVAATGGHVMSCERRSVSAIVPNRVRWCERSVLVASGRGELSLLDSNLQPVTLLDLHHNPHPCLKLFEQLSTDSGLVDVVRCDEGLNQLLVTFNGGPMLTVHLYGPLTEQRFIRQYLSEGKAKEAIGVLRTIDWCNRDEQALHALTSIADQLFKEPLAHDTEELLEETFSTFYSSTKTIDDHVILKHRMVMGCYLRRFFTHLLRHSRLEKAFLLAKDIASSHLFLDIHFAALDAGELPLARLARRKAGELARAENSPPSHHHHQGSVVDDVEVFDRYNLHRDPQDNIDHLEKAFRTKLNTNTKAKSSLKVMNLGYV